MQKIMLLLCACSLLVFGCSGLQKTSSPDYSELERRVEKSGLDIDVDNNNATDIEYGGTNAATAADARTNLGLVIGLHIQAYGANLTTYSSVAPSADAQLLLGYSFADMRTALDLDVGDEIQAYDIDLTSASGASEAGNSKFWGTNATGTVGFYDQSAISLPSGSSTGDLLQWDGDSWAAVSSLSSLVIGGGTANMMAYWDGSGYLQSSSLRPGQITSGATTTPDANTNIGIDTTSDQFKYYGGGVRVLSYKKQENFVVKNPTDADDFILLKAQNAITITNIHCIVSGAGASIPMTVYECTSAGVEGDAVDSAITCDDDGAVDDGSLSNSTIAAGGWVKIKLGSPTGTVSFLTGSIYYTVTAD